MLVQAGVIGGPDKGAGEGKGRVWVPLCSRSRFLRIAGGIGGVELEKREEPRMRPKGLAEVTGKVELHC